MAGPSPRGLYEAARLFQLDSYIESHPEVVRTGIVAAVDQDFEQAREFGDINAAALAAEISGTLLAALGDVQRSAARFLTLVRVLSASTPTARDLETVHAAALSAGARCQDAGIDNSVIECWLIAADAQLQLSRIKQDPLYPPEAYLAHINRGLRYIADIAEYIAEQALPDRNATLLVTFAELTASIGERALNAAWPTRELLGVRALVRRVGRAAERIVTKDVVQLMPGTAQRATEVRERLIRLFAWSAE